MFNWREEEQEEGRDQSNKCCLWIGVGELFLENPLSGKRITPPHRPQVSLTRLVLPIIMKNPFSRVRARKVLPLMDPPKGLESSKGLKISPVWSMVVTLT